MKICYIATPGIHVNRWVSYFANKGHEVHLITSGESSNGIDNVKLHFLKRFGPHIRPVNYLINSVPMMLQFKRLIKKINPDILHAHFISEIAFLGAASGFHPFVATPWGSEIWVGAQKSRVKRQVVKYVLKRADRITYIFQDLKGLLIQLGADPRKMSLVYVGAVNVRKFKPEEKDERLRKELRIVDSPTIISLRRFTPVHDVETLVTAVPLVLREVPKAKFVFAGEGPQGKELRQLAKSLGVSNSIRFIGWVPEDGLPRYLTLADIYVSTALSDSGLAVSTAEAMACGLPVVITDFGDNRRWVEDGVNGFIIPLKAPEVLASKIIQLVKDKEARKRFGSMNREIIVERNNWEKEMRKMSKLYKELTESS